ARMRLTADSTDKDPVTASPARVTLAAPARVTPASPPPVAPAASASAPAPAPAPVAPASPPPLPGAGERAIPVQMHDERTYVDDEPPGAMPKLAVPVGEFGDDAGTELEPAKLRIAYEQSTIKRDAASALLGIPEAPLTVVKQPPVEILLG